MKKILTILLALILSVSLSGCVFTLSNKNKEITFWTLQMGDFEDYIFRTIREYHKLHPNIHIKWVDVPFSEGEKRTLAAIMTDSPPDLINLNPDFSALLAQKGTLEAIPESAVVDFHPEIIEALRYNDVLYSIPWYATSAVTIYNKDLFKKSGVLRLPKTYKELASVSEKIKTIGTYDDFINDLQNSYIKEWYFKEAKSLNIGINTKR